VRTQQTPDEIRYVIFAANSLPVCLTPRLEAAHAAALQKSLKVIRFN